MIIVIKMQSFSDIITNSSTELFCVASGNEIEKYKSIFEGLKGLEGHVNVMSLDGMYDNYDREFYEKIRPYLDETNIVLWVDQDLTIHIDSDIVRRGLVSKLDEVIGKDNYKIYFDEGF